MSVRKEIRKEIADYLDRLSLARGTARSYEDIAGHITALIIERVKGIEEPNWINRWEELGFKGAIQAVIKEVSK